MDVEAMSSVISNSATSKDEEDDVAVLPGFRFHPTDEELVGFYLKRKVDQKRPISIELIKQIDIYKFDPWDLPKGSNVGDKEWYFYCKRGRKYRNSIRPNRVTGSGFWKATGIDRPIYDSDDGDCCIGLKKSLVYYRGCAGKGTKTDWMMHEFRLPSEHDRSNTKQNIDAKNIAQEAEVWTLCRIFKRNVSYRKCIPEWKELSSGGGGGGGNYNKQRITINNNVAASVDAAGSKTYCSSSNMEDHHHHYQMNPGGRQTNYISFSSSTTTAAAATNPSLVNDNFMINRVQLHSNENDISANSDRKPYNNSNLHRGQAAEIIVPNHQQQEVAARALSQSSSSVSHQLPSLNHHGISLLGSSISTATTATADQFSELLKHGDHWDELRSIFDHDHHHHFGPAPMFQ